LGSLAASAADTFEGRIHMEMSAGKRKEKSGMDFSIKAGKVRMDIAAPENSKRGHDGSMGMIFDSKNQEMLMLMDMDGQKMYIRRSVAKEISRATDSKNMGSVPVATGRTEVIAGYPAAEYKSTSAKGEVTEMWLAKGLGTFVSMTGKNPMSGHGETSPEWEKFAREGNFFPMRVVTLNSRGNEETRMEVTKVEKTSLPDSVFSTAGYTEFKMPDFGGALNPFKH
jgi:hypothetical protein